MDARHKVLWRRVERTLYVLFLFERSECLIIFYFSCATKAGSAIIINVILLLLYFILFLLGLHSFTIVMFKQATLVLL